MSRLAGLRGRLAAALAPPPAPVIGTTQTYTHWQWPGDVSGDGGRPGFRSFRYSVTPHTDPAPAYGYFYSHQFALAGGAGGYYGIQTDGLGQRAIFSIWDALDATGPATAKPFGGEGEGYQTVIPFRWEPEGTYHLEVRRSGADGHGTRWTATIQTGGSAEGVEQIGTITVPAGWGGLASQSIMWSERYAGPPPRTCADLGHSEASFSRPSANAGKVGPVGHVNRLADPGGCPDAARFVDLPDGGVRQIVNRPERR